MEHCKRCGKAIEGKDRPATSLCLGCALEINEDLQNRSDITMTHLRNYGSLQNTEEMWSEANEIVKQLTVLESYRTNGFLPPTMEDNGFSDTLTTFRSEVKRLAALRAATQVQELVTEAAASDDFQEKVQRFSKCLAILETVKKDLQDSSQLDALEQTELFVKRKRLQARTDSFLAAARKAELKECWQEAIDIYHELLYLLESQGSIDQDQQAHMTSIRGKIDETKSKL